LPLIAGRVGIPLSKVAAVATFYKAFSFEPKGKTVLRVCMGTACHVKGANLIKEEAERQLGSRTGQTTPDGEYTLEEVNCVGACAMARVFILEDKYHGKFKAIDLKSLLTKGAAESDVAVTAAQDSHVAGKEGAA